MGTELVPRTSPASACCSAVPHEKVGQNRVHFDLTTTSLDDQDETVAELLALGATHIDIGQRPDDTHVVLADPEGNELCIIEPSNRFLASCPRLGAVNCDGTGARVLLQRGARMAAGLGSGRGDGDPGTRRHRPEDHLERPSADAEAAEERFHFHIAPTPGTSPLAPSSACSRLGATRRDGRGRRMPRRNRAGRRRRQSALPRRAVAVGISCSRWCCRSWGRRGRSRPAASGRRTACSTGASLWLTFGGMAA